MKNPENCQNLVWIDGVVTTEKCSKPEGHKSACVPETGSSSVSKPSVPSIGAGSSSKMDDTQYWEQGTKKLDHMFQAVDGVVSMLPVDLKMKVKTMLAGPVGEAFFTAPASTRRSFHYAFPGGLVAHSLNVVKNTMRMYRALDCLTRWPEWKPAFCALFHDFGKAGDGVRPYYVPTKSQWKVDKGEHYDLNTEPGYMPSSELGLYVLSQHGIVLEPEMHIAIRLNDGPAARGNVDYAFLEPDLAVLINMADNWSMRQEKREDSR